MWPNWSTHARDVEARGFTLKQAESGRLVLSTGRQPIEFWAYAAINNYQQPLLKQQYQFVFQQASGGKDFVLEKNLSGPDAVQFQFLRTIFDPADANGDGKLTRAEFDDFFDLQDSFRNIALSVTPAIQTPTLFQLLDENRDGRLGVRELRTAWESTGRAGTGQRGCHYAGRDPAERFAAADARDGSIHDQPASSRDTQLLQRECRCRRRGQSGSARWIATRTATFPAASTWARRAEFDSIDRDHDGLIGLQEATAYDKKMRRSEEKSAAPKKK